MFDVEDDAKAAYRRVEVLTGPGRRRRWSAEEEARVVAESFAPGAVVRAVARRWPVCPQQLFGWRREARMGSPASAPDGTGPPVPAFVPLVGGAVMPEGSPDAPAAAEVAPAPPIEVESAGAVARVRTGADAGLLAAVLRAVRASAPPA